MRGINSNSNAKCFVVKAFIEGCKCGVIYLQETKLADISTEKFHSFCGSHIRDFRFLGASGSRGGILTAWNPALFECDNYWVGEFSLNLVLRRRIDGTIFTLSNIYGPTAAALKAGFFLELRHIGTRVAGVWALLGDFNLLLSLSDKNDPPSSVSDILSFRNAVNGLGLADIPLSNRSFTWTNGRPTPTLERLDRALLSKDWMLHFPRSTLRALPRPTSDHSPLLLTAFSFVPAAHLFRLESFWLRYRGAREVISGSWAVPTSEANSAHCFASKLALVSGKLSEWSVGLLKRIKEQTDSCLAWIDWLDRTEEARQLTTEERGLRCGLKVRYDELCYQDELRWRQRSRV